MHQAGWCVHENVSAQVSELSSFFFTPLSSLFSPCLQLCVFVTTALQRQKVKCCIGAAVIQAGRQ